MREFRWILYFTVLLFAAQNSFSQVVTTVSESIYGPTREQSKQAAAVKKNNKGVGGKDENGMIKQPPEESINYELFKGSREKNREKFEEAKAVALTDIQEINSKLTAPQKYLSMYPAYINKQDAGIFRLFPNKDCGKGKTVNIAELERCGNLPQILGFGSKFSFRLSTVPSDMFMSIGFLFAFPDIQFAENKLKAGNELMETLITEIGEKDFESLNSKSEELKFLVKWKKSGSKKALIKQQEQVEKGIDADGYHYSTSVPVKLNSVYALRSIAYYQQYKAFWNTDLLIAFKIVGQEKDGSLIIIWKQLRKKDAPIIYMG